MVEYIYKYKLHITVWRYKIISMHFSIHLSKQTTYSQLYKLHSVRLGYTSFGSAYLL